jgi:23S rRNA (uracil1939-C5)-methyltransferase
MPVDDKVGNIIETKIIDLAYNGKSVGELDGKIIFVNGGLPGETVRAKIIKRKPRYSVGHIQDIIEKSDERIKAPCPHFDICGGCTWQDLSYEQQLYYKRKQVVDSLKHIGKIENAEIADAIGCEDQFFYRNKMEYSFNVTEDNNFTLGLHKRGRFDEIFDVENCLLQSPESNRIVIWFRQYIKENNLEVYDVTAHTGFIRFLMIRQTQNSDQIMINIVTTEGEIPDVDKMINSLTTAFPQVKTIVQNINSSKSNIAKGEIERILFGDGYIEEKILGYGFRIYANSFFQTNSRQTELLYRKMLDALQPEKTDRLLDLYCGTGTIGICASGHVDRVIGIDSEPSAIQAAIANARNNNVENINFIAGTAKETLLNSAEDLNLLTCAVIDPPRAGMHPGALKRLIAMNYNKIVYISCNPATFSRDAVDLIKAGYKMGIVTPVDMFPHTMHIEVVCGFYKTE